jgi:phosphoribosylformimino-5-aminoimidazole carboxamide ribotide isomerase
MILYPAIDLKAGQCVRLRQGDMAQATVFNNDPSAQAASFEADGFSWLHVVDLDGAFAGKPVNGAAVDGILARVKFPRWHPRYGNRRGLALEGCRARDYWYRCRA